MEGNRLGRFFRLAQASTALTVLVFAAGIIVNSASATQPTMPSGTSTSALAINAVTYNWTTSTDATTYAVYKSVISSTTGFTLVSSSIDYLVGSYTFTGLATNTRYWLSVAAVSSTADIATSSPATTTPFFTLAAAAGAPTLGTPTLSTIPLTLNANANPSASTTYSIYNITVGAYLDSAGLATAGNAQLFQSSSTWDTTLAATGLTANTSYTFSVQARNGDNTTSATSSASSAVYSLTNAPSSPTVTVTSPLKLVFSWTGDANATFYAENTTKGTNSGWISASSFDSVSLSCGTSYSFRVKARNADVTPVETDWSSTATATTGGCGGGGGGAGGGSATPATPATPAVPTVSPATPATPATPAAASVKVSNVANSIIKVNSSNRPAVYYLLNGMKYLFVNRATYSTWSADAGDTANKFSTLKMISQAEFDAIPTGGNLVVKPGSLIKFDNSPKIFGVGTGGKLYEVANAAAQKALYGSAAPSVIQTGFRDGYFDHGNAAGTLTETSQKPE